MQEDAKIQIMTTSPLSMFRRMFASEIPRPDAISRMGRRLGSFAATALLCLTLAGCFSEQFQKGYILPENALSQIPIGASQDQVLLVLGTPSTVATVNGEVFYYISQRSERVIAFMNQNVTDQRVIAVYFDKNRNVERLANYGIQDGKIFDFVSRTTTTGGQDMSYLTYIFRLIKF